MAQKWNDRYQHPEFAYGKAPNVFFEKSLPHFEAGHILMPADGEGRNGVFAATVGWQVTSFDQSSVGQRKALQLAAEHNVSLDYIVSDLEDLHLEPESFDAIGLIYAHFDADKKSRYHRKLNEYLRPGGIVIFEAFSKRHLEFVTRNPQVGGPRGLDDLFSEEEIILDFPNFEILTLRDEIIRLNEGMFHIGEGAVIRFVGRKK
ncbi:class I SAM-dependent methyltransferase [Chitinophaga pendula]|uniref:class I SAM-dependent methyltransferase n=1 Tax=Chitinophaga TaxID=79328 RepID=UPI000BAF3DB1|nr:MULTISPECIES: class I SAM-dependent methyltransferase [Chitinophaga]ASZ11558.1 SAM-dependent methyltransferase [Chitinophaga sp. MD30]UCJ05432.1 class I SAM-dependent methyltransferase [Chitinophaga pendula]